MRPSSPIHSTELGVAQEPCWINLESCSQRLNTDDEAGNCNRIDAGYGPSHTVGLSELDDSNTEYHNALGVYGRKGDL